MVSDDLKNINIIYIIYIILYVNISVSPDIY